MPHRDRKLWNSAERIVAALQKNRQATAVPRLPLQHQSELLRLQRQAEKAQQRGWWAAAHCVRQELSTRGQWFVNDLQRFVIEVQTRSDEPCATVGDIYRDVLALMAEFKYVHVDRPETTVSVVTERIILNEIDLGPFEVIWNWSLLGEGEELRVVPLEPNPAGENEDVCHPHVRDNALCLGDASLPLERAFQAGRLFDAFLILRQVLQTYNPQSAYVRLADWNGGSCELCDASMSEDEGGHCERCQTVLCEECLRFCIRCGDGLCPDCRKTCLSCHEPVCSRCRPVVTGPQSQLCQYCYDEEMAADEDSAEDEDPAAVPETPPDNTHPPVLPDRVGETGVSAGCG